MKQIVLFSIGLIALILPHSVVATNVVVGKIFHDKNENLTCDNELVLRGWFVSVEDISSKKIRFVKTDDYGNYRVELDAGTFAINVVAPNKLWLPNEQNTIITFLETENKIFTLNFAMKTLANCPVLAVDLAASTFPTASENTLTVRFCNNGTADAVGASVGVRLDSSLELVGASLSSIRQNAYNFQFPVGNLAVNECQIFTIQTRVSASVLSENNKTFCSESRVLSPSICDFLQKKHFTQSDSAAASIVRNTSKGGNSNGGAKFGGRNAVIIDQIIFTRGDDPTNVNTNPTDVQFLDYENALSALDGEGLPIPPTFTTAFFGDEPRGSFDPSVAWLCQTPKIKGGKLLNDKNQTNNVLKTDGDDAATANDWHLAGGLSNQKGVASRVFPNPILETARIEIKGKNLENAVFDLFDINGRRVWTENLTTNATVWQRQGLPSGVYIFKISANGVPLSIGKLVLQ